jgi:hypothetical protein
LRPVGAAWVDDVLHLACASGGEVLAICGTIAALISINVRTTEHRVLPLGEHIAKIGGGHTNIVPSATGIVLFSILRGLHLCWLTSRGVVGASLPVFDFSIVGPCVTGGVALLERTRTSMAVAICTPDGRKSPVLGIDDPRIENPCALAILDDHTIVLMDWDESLYINSSGRSEWMEVVQSPLSKAGPQKGFPIR